jgi:hypothetical protein
MTWLLKRHHRFHHTTCDACEMSLHFGFCDNHSVYLLVNRFVFGFIATFECHHISCGLWLNFSKGWAREIGTKSTKSFKLF